MAKVRLANFILFSVFLLSGSTSPALAEVPAKISTPYKPNFITPPGLEPQVRFWRKIYFDAALPVKRINLLLPEKKEGFAIYWEVGSTVRLKAFAFKWDKKIALKKARLGLVGIRYMEGINKILTAYKLPEDLRFLPQAGSFFHTNAVSSADAVGIWQLSRETGKQFMRVRDDIDERRDFILSTHAAAKILGWLT